MTFQGDPYRTLGIPPNASLNEIRSAYRRLAKKYHPDAAGERALARFLAIQAAYERLVDSDGQLRAAGGGGDRGGAKGSAEPWRADPARARASRDAWRARRATGTGRTPGWGSDTGGRRSGTPGGGASSTPGGGASSSPGGGASSTPGGASTGADRRGARPGGGASSRPGDARSDRSSRRAARKATPGSTTYDDAAEAPRDPAWSGGAWYGPSTGTYWTLNPREYADPRKHGPEYLARAWRATRDQAAATHDPWVDEGTAPGGTADGVADTGGDAGRRAATGPAPEPTPETGVVGGGGRWRWKGSAAGGRPEGGGSAVVGSSGSRSAPGGSPGPGYPAGGATEGGPTDAADAGTTTDGAEAVWGTRAWRYDTAHDPDARWTTGPSDRREGRRRSAPRTGYREAASVGTSEPAGSWGRADASGRAVAAGREEAPALPDLETVVRRAAPRNLLSLARRPDRRWRLLLAIVGWPPIGYALGALLSMADGCASYSAACREPLPLLPILVQPLVVGALALVPPAAAAAAFASLAMLAVAVPVAAILSVGSLPESRAAAPVLGFLSAVAYFVGLAFASVTVWRAGPGPAGDGP